MRPVTVTSAILLLVTIFEDVLGDRWSDFTTDSHPPIVTIIPKTTATETAKTATPPFDVADQKKWLQRGGAELTRLLRTWIDRKRSPCKDFTGYTCARYLAAGDKAEVIGPDRTNDANLAVVVQLFSSGGRGSPEAKKSVVFQAASKIFRECLKKKSVPVPGEEVIYEVRNFASDNGLASALVPVAESRSFNSSGSAATRFARSWAQLLSSHRSHPMLDLLGVDVIGPYGRGDRPPYILAFGAQDCENKDFKGLARKIRKVLDNFGKQIGATRTELRKARADLKIIATTLRVGICYDNNNDDKTMNKKKLADEHCNDDDDYDEDDEDEDKNENENEDAETLSVVDNNENEDDDAETVVFGTAAAATAAAAHDDGGGGGGDDEKEEEKDEDVDDESADKKFQWKFLTAAEATRRWPRFDFGVFLDEWSSKMDPEVRTTVMNSDYRIAFDSKQFDGIHKTLIKLGDRGTSNLVALNFLDDFGAIENAPTESYRKQNKGRLPQRWLPRRNTKIQTLSVAENYCLNYVSTFTKSFAYVQSVPIEKRKLIRGDLQLMVKYIFAGLSSMFEQVSWLTEKTRNRAIAKIAHLKVNLLYPPEFETSEKFDASHSKELLERIRNYLDVSQPNASLSREILRAFQNENYRKKMATVALENNDREAFSMPIFWDNAEYSPELNALEIPLGTARPPNFFAGAPFAWNFGGIGSTVGHELSHAFDPNGVKYNETGYLDDWMDETAVKNYAEETRCVIDEYNHFCDEAEFSAHPNGTCVNGELTKNENMADIAGLHAAFRGYAHFRDTDDRLETHLGKPFDKFSDEQLFFIAFSSTYCSPPNVDERFDVHTPARWRSEGSIRNQPAFRRAFGCAVGTRFAPQNYCNVWITQPKRKHAKVPAPL